MKVTNIAAYLTTVLLVVSGQNIYGMRSMGVASASSSSSSSSSEPIENVEDGILKELQAISEELICPITHELMQDPVLAADGRIYERASIEAWFARRNITSPVTRVH